LAPPHLHPLPTRRSSDLRSSVALTDDRFGTGLASELDVRQARSLLATTESVVPVLESQREQTLHALGVLVGREPDALQDDLARPDRKSTRLNSSHVSISY